LLVAGVAAAAVLALAACGKPTIAAGPTPSSPPASPAADGSAEAAITVAATSVPGVGTVLVNGSGRTFYVLTSEAGGKITCTDDNGCTKVWPDTELPSGKTAALAGSGAQASRLGTVRSSDGKLYVTYAGYPLYTYSGDSAPGTAAGQGIVSFGGTWTAVTPAGTLVTAGSPSPTPSARPSSSSGY
jgi:predicted lipoprotein with Yx(FWY)xxD motif